jgi:hypothetical protein
LKPQGAGPLFLEHDAVRACFIASQLSRSGYRWLGPVPSALVLQGNPRRCRAAFLEHQVHRLVFSFSQSGDMAWLVRPGIAYEHRGAGPPSMEYHFRGSVFMISQS